MIVISSVIITTATITDMVIITDCITFVALCGPTLKIEQNDRQLVDIIWKSICMDENFFD